MPQQTETDILALHCNFPCEGGKPCGKELEEAWATSCSHLFCSEHMKEWFATDERCPICLDKQGKVKMLRVTTSKDRSARVHSLLVGLSPPEIQIAASSAMRFWLEQKCMEYQQERKSEQELMALSKRLTTNGRERLTEADALKQSLEASSEALRRQLREAKQKNARDREELNKVRSRFARLREDFKEAQGKTVGLQARAPMRSELAEAGRWPSRTPRRKAGTPIRPAFG